MIFLFSFNNNISPRTRPLQILQCLVERFALGKIDEPLFQKVYRKIDDEIMELREKTEIPEITTSNFKTNLNKAMDFIQNVSKYWISGDINLKKKIQKLVFPSGFYIIPYSRQYLTTDVNQLFRLTNKISKVCEGDKKEPPSKMMRIPTW
jgi:site-specific DNA recombinase